ncbi:urocanate hydratase [Galendromus occidentalis]|uniref:Urocanate hydratase n=1 Tax=Galendromus occidentalis TaxID=34638 RepID=A0AAJ6VWY2_9ACAR|nr:urocanate hydratase [Galendromus occidentalis]
MSENIVEELCRGLPSDRLPEPRKRSPDVPHAPVRNVPLSAAQTKTALANALRYFPQRVHHILATEFAEELRDYGHIYMYRFMPSQHLKALPIDEYKAKSLQAAAIMLMICNNLDPQVAQFPEELVTYGGNGQVFSNWAQFRLVMHYLSKMTDSQTLVMYSGHPLGLFPSTIGVSPRVVITNGMVIPGYSTPEDYDRMFAMGVTMYGQMTAGSYCYIGPQGIVHGTTITIMNAGRKYLHLESLKGIVFVTSGLGGMSGAQAKASVIAGAVGVIAEVNKDALLKRYQQGWLHEICFELPDLVQRIKRAKRDEQATSIGFHGNIVDLWEYLAQEAEESGELLVELGSDQTSCHNPFNGGYYPAELTFEESNEMMTKDPSGFRKLVQKSLRRHVAAIDALAAKGMCFWDYGNGFLLEASRAGADVGQDGIRFKYPSYVQDIMGDIFSMGFGPFRWVCTSGDSDDLQLTDKIACQVLRELLNSDVSDNIKCQYSDNIRWIEKASLNSLVVGSQARILYSDRRGRMKIAQALNAAVKTQRLKGPVVLSRDHHDVSGVDSPFRETSNIYDGSAFTADMAVQNFVGDALRGATWVALHNGGGVGWGQVINGGFGMLLDGSVEAHDRATCLLSWDVNNGIARRGWSGNSYALETIRDAMEEDPSLEVTLPHAACENEVEIAVKKCFKTAQ